MGVAGDVAVDVENSEETLIEETTLEMGAMTTPTEDGRLVLAVMVMTNGFL